jgi:hypothetical protein
MSPRRSKGIDYTPPENGEAVRRAMHETGLEKEIALLRVKLETYVREDQTDIGLILAVVNGIGRALLAQARTGGGGESANVPLRRLMRYYGDILKNAGDETRIEGNDGQHDS